MFALSSLTLAIVVIGDPDPTKENDLFRSNSRTVILPLRMQQERQRDVSAVVLYVSDDNGQTWRQAQLAGPDAGRFTFKAERDGTYWFTLQTIQRDGKKEPREVSTASPTIKVRIITGAPVPPPE